MADVYFGGDNAWKVQRVGDIMRAYHWVSGEPAMVIYPMIPRSEGVGAFVVCLSAAFKYDNIRYLVKQSAIAARVIGMDETGHTIRRIGTAIHDGLLDLIKMPPEPQWLKERHKGEVVGEMEIRANGKTVMKREVHENEKGNLDG